MVDILNVQRNSKFLKEITCNKCCSELRYSPIEVQQRSFKDYNGGGLELIDFIKCPVCNNDINL